MDLAVSNDRYETTILECPSGGCHAYRRLYCLLVESAVVGGGGLTVSQWSYLRRLTERLITSGGLVAGIIVQE